MLTIPGLPANFDDYEINKLDRKEAHFFQQTNSNENVALYYVEIDRTKRNPNELCSYVYVKPQFYDEAKKTFANWTNLSKGKEYYFYTNSTEETKALIDAMIKTCECSSKVKEKLNMLARRGNI